MKIFSPFYTFLALASVGRGTTVSHIEAKGFAQTNSWQIFPYVVNLKKGRGYLYLTPLLNSQGQLPIKVHTQKEITR